MSGGLVSGLVTKIPDVRFWATFWAWFGFTVLRPATALFLPPEKIKSASMISQPFWVMSWILMLFGAYWSSQNVGLHFAAVATVTAIVVYEAGLLFDWLAKPSDGTHYRTWTMYNRVLFVTGLAISLFFIFGGVVVLVIDATGFLDGVASYIVMGAGCGILALVCRFLP